MFAIDWLTAPLVTLAIGIPTLLISYKNYSLTKKKEKKLEVKIKESITIHLTSILDVFAQQCSMVAIDYGQDDKNGITRPISQLPKFKISHIENELMHLNMKTLCLVREIEAITSMAECSISVLERNYDDAPDFNFFFHERRSQYFIIGVKAMRLSNQLKKSTGIPSSTRTKTKTKTNMLTYVRNRRELKNINKKTFYSHLP